MEIKNKVRDLYFPECPIRNVIARIGDRWSILVLLTLEPAEKPMRFKEIEQAIPDISQKMLTRTLRDLEADGYVNRHECSVRSCDDLAILADASDSVRVKHNLKCLMMNKRMKSNSFLFPLALV